MVKTPVERLENDGTQRGVAGKLVVCPTPLGNLEDITLRVLRALRESDVIFAEDTRVTKTLLRHFEIRTPLRSFHKRTQSSRLHQLRELLRKGKTVAVVSDAGMPGISDPGVELVREARACGATIEALPGPSAVPAALVLSGYDISSFRFDGFPPRKPGERREYLTTLENERAAIVWFEAPNRILTLLREVAEVLPRRNLFVVREYTKKFEQHIWGTAAKVLLEIELPPRGEFTLVLEGAHDKVAAGQVSGDVEKAIALLRKRGMSAKDTTEAMRLTTGLSKNELYRLAVRKRNDRDSR